MHVIFLFSAEVFQFSLTLSRGLFACRNKKGRSRWGLRVQIFFYPRFSLFQPLILHFYLLPVFAVANFKKLFLFFHGPLGNFFECKSSANHGFLTLYTASQACQMLLICNSFDFQTYSEFITASSLSSSSTLRHKRSESVRCSQQNLFTST